MNKIEKNKPIYYLLMIILVFISITPVSAVYLDYYAYGDSITSYADNYVHQLNSNYCPEKTVDHNTDGSGQTSQWASDNIAVHWNADGIGTLILEFGIVDEINGVSETECFSNIYEMYNYSISQGSDCIVLLPIIAHSSWGAWASLTNQTTFVNSLESDLISAGIPYVKAYDAVDSAPLNGYPEVITSENSYDAAPLHPNTLGHTHIGRLIWSETESSWLEGWNYRTLINISGSSSNQTNYPIMFSIYNISGENIENSIYLGENLEDNIYYSDICFTVADGLGLIDAWNETYYNNHLDCWVEIPSLPIYGSFAYMYYGKIDSINTYNGSNTFPSWYEHFFHTIYLISRP